MVARLDEPKDHSTLFSALAELTNKNWVLDLIGDGPREDEIHREVDVLGITDHVNFLGIRHDVAALLASSQLFILASKSEGFPRSILEAMRAGLPVIASDVGGVSEAVIDGETGFLVPRENVELLSNKIEYLLDHAQERIRMGKAGRRRFEQEFLFERMAEQTFRLYKQLVG